MRTPTTGPNPSLGNLGDPRQLIPPHPAVLAPTKSSRHMSGMPEPTLNEDVIAEMNLVWQKLERRHHKRGALMGCSIQPAPGASKKEAEG